MKKYPCPKCGAKHSWFEQDGDDLIQRCLCGLTHYLFRELEDGITVMRSGVRVPDVTLPAEGTKIRKCLLAVRNAHPRTIRTGDIASGTGLRGKETASLVVTLMGRGLLERVAARRGLLGGSIWRLTVVAQTLLKVDNKGVDDYGTSIGNDGGKEFLLSRHTGRGGEDLHSESGEFEDSWIDHKEGDDWS
jgi:hypothetical protein